MSKINCIVIEDNIIDRIVAEDFVSKITYLKLTGSYSNSLDAKRHIRDSGGYILLLMDIDMPVINGIDFFKSLSTNSLCIFITSHPEYYPERFTEFALDYIIKPLKFEQFELAVARANEYFDIKRKVLLNDLEFENDRLSAKAGTTSMQIKFNDIIYMEALGEYIKIITSEKKYLTPFNLKEFVEKLPAGKFLRIHRNYAVARDKISRLDQNELRLKKIKLPIERTFRKEMNKGLIRQ